MRRWATRTAAAAGAVALLATVVMGCGSGSKSAGPKRPIGGFHYNGSTEDDTMMTFSAYGLSLPLFEAKFACGKSVGTTSIEAVKVQLRDGRYRFDLKVKALVGYEDGAPDENGDVRIRGRFATDAETARGDVTVTTSRCTTGAVKWSATAEPDVRRGPVGSARATG